MSRAIGEVLPFGLGVALSPAAVIAVVLMLVAPGGRVRASVFVGVWIISLAGTATVALLLVDGADARRGGSPADWAIAVQIVLAVLLVLLATQQWRGRTGGADEPELPGWMKKVDGLTTPGAASMALFLAAGKPKGLILTVGAAVAVGELGVSTGAQAAGLAAFTFVGTLAVGAPLAVSLLSRDGGTAVLGRVRSWMVRENRTIVAVVCLVFAAKLLGDALVAFGS